MGRLDLSCELSFIIRRNAEIRRELTNLENSGASLFALEEILLVLLDFVLSDVGQNRVPESYDQT